MSVVLPTYARPDKLVEAAESVAAQSYPNVELVVVDDASPVPAREVLAERSLDGLRWRCFRHDSNRGANAARNTGIRESDGEIVAFIDDDDYWLPEKLEAQVDRFREGGSEVGVVLSAQEFVYEGEVTATRMPEVEGDATAELLEGKIAGTFSAIAVRRSAVDAAGLPDERLPSWQDREWLIRLSTHCEFAIDPRPLVVRRSGEYGQISDDFEAKRDVSYPLFLEKHRDLAAELGREREFVVSLTKQLATVGLRNGFHADARRFAAMTIRLDPTLLAAYVYFILSLTTPRLLRAIVRTKRFLAHCGRSLGEYRSAGSAVDQ